MCACASGRIFYSRKFWRAKIYYAQYLHEWRGTDRVLHYMAAPPHLYGDTQYSGTVNRKSYQLTTSSPGQIYQLLSTGALLFRPPPPHVEAIFSFSFDNLLWLLHSFCAVCLRRTIQCDHGNVLCRVGVCVRARVFSLSSSAARYITIARIMASWMMPSRKRLQYAQELFLVELYVFCFYSIQPVNIPFDHDSIVCPNISYDIRSSNQSFNGKCKEHAPAPRPRS